MMVLVTNGQSKPWEVYAFLFDASVVIDVRRRDGEYQQAAPEFTKIVLEDDRTTERYIQAGVNDAQEWCDQKNKVSKELRTRFTSVIGEPIE